MELASVIALATATYAIWRPSIAAWLIAAGANGVVACVIWTA